VSGFFGWQAYRKQDGWYAMKCVAKDEYNTTNLVWRKHPLDIDRDAPRYAAEREIRRLYMVGRLKD